MEFAIHNISGKDTGKKVKLDKDVFGIEPGTEYKFDFEFEA